MKNYPRVGDLLMLSMKRSLLCGLMLTVLPALSFGQGVKVEYAHLDGIGNVIAVSNAAGVEIESHDYLPFGEEWCGTSVCGSVKAGQSKRFTGKERDAETGLDYFGARYYGSKIGRFTTIDPVFTWQENLGDPQRWNRYAYAKNNPLRYVDPDGKDAGEAAALLQSQVSYAANFYIGGAVNSGSPALAAGTAFVSSALEIGINGIAEGFRVGESTGAALGRGDTGLAFAAALSEDAGRVGGLLLLGVGGTRPVARGAGAADVRASTPVGRLGSPLEVKPGTNGPATIGGRAYTGHALDRMQGRGITPSVVEDTIARGAQTAGRRGATVHTTEQARVILNPNGSVKTTYPK